MSGLWKKLLTRESLTRGWHLARIDVKQDFAEDLFATDAYAQSLLANVDETIAQLRTGTYQPSPLFRVEVPKGTLGFRPGSVIPIRDRVVLAAITVLMAPKIDRKLPDSVYSWRLKDPLPKKGAIFEEQDITELPFLKKATIRDEIDPFQAWYRLWPQFDKKTRHIFQVEKYRFLATSDISAYFENIQIPILRDQLLTHNPSDAELVNLLCLFLESWSDKTSDGRVHHRGIPQGNFISSFLGNIFLLPLDQAFTKFCKDRDVKYFRYMDDVRIFTKNKEDARVALFEMARRLRELHLNVQTAKTRVYDELASEISSQLIDPRTDALNELHDRIKKALRDREPNETDRRLFGKELQRIAKLDVDQGQKILGARNPLEGLSMRSFSRWVTGHMAIESDYFIKRLLTEIRRSADNKLTKKLLSTTRRFPRHAGISSGIVKLIKDRQIIFPYQEAECFRALRYLNNIPEDLQALAWARLTDEKSERYLRMQAAYLLSRTLVNKRRLDRLDTLFYMEPDPYVRIAIACVVVQDGKGNRQLIQNMVLHPNEKIRSVGKYFRMVKNETRLARATLRNAFRTEVHWAICDNVPLLYVISDSNSASIRQLLLREIQPFRKNHRIVGLRPVFDRLDSRLHQSLSAATTPE